MIKRLCFSAWLLAILISMPGCDQAGKSSKKPAAETPSGSSKAAAPEFTLIDSAGAPFSSSSLEGRIWVANMFFTTCPSICPAVSANLMALQQSLRSEPGIDAVRVLSISVDPETDTPEKLREYGTRFAANPRRWIFLTGEREKIWKLSKEGFHLPVEEGGDSGHGIISHSSKLLLFGRKGELLGVFEGTDSKEVGGLGARLRELLADPATSVSNLYVPEDVQDTFWLEERAESQLATRDQFTVPHGFSFTDMQPRSGLDFLHRIVDDGGKTYKAAHYDHGSGIAVADVDGDALLDLYLVTQAGPNGLYRNLGGGRFEDITRQAGVAVADSIGVAASFADIDNDGDADLYVTNVRTPNRLFLNEGGGAFRDVSAKSGLDYSEHSSAGVFFDYNNDGLLDLLLCVVGEYTSDQVVEVTGTVLHERDNGPAAKFHVAYPDAFAGHLKPERHRASKLYRNDGNHTFTDVTKATGLADTGWTGAATPVDFNQDGYLDLYLLNMQGHDGYWENIKGETFVARSSEVFRDTPWGTMGVKSFDYNNDGRMDLFITDMHSDMSKDIGFGEEKLKSTWAAEVWTESYLDRGGRGILGNALFRNDGNGDFTEVSDEMNSENYWPWGVSTGDLNADGWQDVFITSGMNYPFRYGVNSVLLNNQGKRFLDAEFILGVEPRRDGRVSKPWFRVDCSGPDGDKPLFKGKEGMVIVNGAVGTRSSAIFDLDGDGDLDIVTNEFGDVPQVLVSNLSEQSPEMNHVKIRLRGTGSNRDALGAKVTLQAGGLTLTQVNDGQSGYLAQSSLPLYFGLGTADKIDEIKVVWPGGKTSVVEGEAKLNDTIEIIEPEA